MYEHSKYQNTKHNDRQQHGDKNSQERHREDHRGDNYSSRSHSQPSWHEGRDREYGYREGDHEVRRRPDRQDTDEATGGNTHHDSQWRDDSNHYRSGHRNADQNEGFRGRGPRNYDRSDERLCDDICERLTDDDRVDASHIEVNVEDGVATLTGEVETRKQRLCAEQVTDSIRGIKNIKNEITVKSHQDSGSSEATKGKSTDNKKAKAA